MTLIEMGQAAKVASSQLAVAGAAQKDAALRAAADALEQGEPMLLEANRKDVQAAEAARMRPAMLDRLTLDHTRISNMADGMRQVAAQEDPIGQVIEGRNLPNGLEIRRVRVPLGVIGIIFEARPNVTADAAALCLKAGNAVILRGGKEAIHSNTVCADLMRGAVEKTGLPRDCIQLVQDTSRSSSTGMMQMTGYLDVLIPRGGRGLIQSVVQNAKVPVIQTGAGNCHVYVDDSADIEMAANIVDNAKTSRPSVCNAMETLLVHQDIAEKALPVIGARLLEKHVELRGCPRTRAILGTDKVVPATEADWATEYDDYILAIKVVDSLEQALTHIAKYSTGHSECIVTRNYRNARIFQQRVDSAAVYVNASTRFTDGGEFGLGAEIGISTQKLHARGPMGVNQLTSTKFLVMGDGQVRA
ncbi:MULTISPECIES: glutamate-5-semialdehyde dehydrogenase [Caproicibacterium]|jgi:glutamate-5-semialdehyde dehydrogenase|uniref:Gamma-glutamyl phosphate reductase n=1 Tax=Caproicibacterium lactatifermentans TaxID=2666138 RepID=A0A859DRY7_9FIRM|nr:glutamate-5-semialdehyde dehydrogenase [Caproicibacterium lactatifermentans]ARP51178.1 glutamate-5-semialdehyde dehydrogenase [Ruminococcaceae bacterium CPB6]MDD4806985.1 glutamate-5-semialdehyde dehydrogenase [Oscillospiraceae bacterium]QKN24678.1 glutamate-5-semialdehyde dehydrogenase [Caproicibacterium lactatifermentans]QKO30177.1 glutamate-5-semialdehyde dehydrogenase [Caproicibacterium lactatifermentans]